MMNNFLMTPRTVGPRSENFYPEQLNFSEDVYFWKKTPWTASIPSKSRLFHLKPFLLHYLTCTFLCFPWLQWTLFLSCEHTEYQADRQAADLHWVYGAACHDAWNGSGTHSKRHGKRYHAFQWTLPLTLPLPLTLMLPLPLGVFIPLMFFNYTSQIFFINQIYSSEPAEG